MGVMVWFCSGDYGGGDVSDTERPCWGFFFFFFLCQRLRERDKKEKSEREIVKKE